MCVIYVLIAISLNDGSTDSIIIVSRNQLQFGGYPPVWNKSLSILNWRNRIPAYEFPSLCSNRYDKDRLHMFSIKPFKYNFPPKAQMVDNPGNWGHYVDKKCPFTGLQPRLMVWGSTTWKSQKKLWYILSCVIYDILYILYKCHIFYDFVWCILYAFYGIDIWYILWCCMSCIGVSFPMIYNIH